MTEKAKQQPTTQDDANVKFMLGGGGWSMDTDEGTIAIDALVLEADLDVGVFSRRVSIEYNGGSWERVNDLNDLLDDVANGQRGKGHLGAGNNPKKRPKRMSFMPITDRNFYVIIRLSNSIKWEYPNDGITPPFSLAIAVSTTTEPPYKKFFVNTQVHADHRVACFLVKGKELHAWKMKTSPNAATNGYEIALNIHVHLLGAEPDDRLAITIDPDVKWPDGGNPV